MPHEREESEKRNNGSTVFSHALKVDTMKKKQEHKCECEKTDDKLHGS